MAIPRSLANFAAYADASSNGPTINGLNAGKGVGQVATNTAFGVSALNSNTTGTLNTAIGGGANIGALELNTIGVANTAIGGASFDDNTTGSYNTGLGYGTGHNVTTGTKNTSIGYSGSNNQYLSAGATNQFYAGTYDYDVLTFTTTAGTSLDGITAGKGNGRILSNVAFGISALSSNTTGSANIAIGGWTNGAGGALLSNTIGQQNVAIGAYSLDACTTGSYNTCISGWVAGHNITTGQKNVVLFAGDGPSQEGRLTAGSTNVVTIGTPDYEVFRFASTTSTLLDGLNAGRGAGRLISNVAFGAAALASNTTGADNVAIGGHNGASGGALQSNTIGIQNIAIGPYAMENCTTGSNNTCIAGWVAGRNITTGQKNVVLYAGDGPAQEGRLSAGSTGVMTFGTVDAERIRVNTDGFLVPLAYSQTSGSAANMYIDSTGKMFRSTSSARYKKNIQDAVHNLSDVLKLRSVTFNHINPDEDGILYGGLIAEEVHDAGLTEFVEYTWDGRPDGVRYGHMVSLLVKAVQELNAKVVALESR